MKKPNSSKSAFSLVEMLTVVTITALLTAFAAPAIMGVSASGQMNQNLLTMSGLLEEARQYAVAQNTYVWVAVQPGTNADGTSILSVALLASTDGTDPAGAASWSSNAYGTVPNSQISLINKIATLRQVSLANAGTFDTSIVPNLPATPAPVSAVANSLATNSTGFFNIQLPGTSGTKAFTQAAEFTPSGEVRNTSSPVGLVELDLQGKRGTAADANNLAVIRVNGITGECVTYRR